MNQIIINEFEETKRKIVIERENFNRNSLRGPRALIAIDDNQIIRYAPAEGEELFKPEYEIVDIDLNKIEVPPNKIHPHNKMELVEFYKDGLLIRLDAPQTAFFTFKITSPDKLALLQDLRVYDANSIL